MKPTKLVSLEKNIKPENIRIFFGEYNGFQRYDFYKHNFAKVIERLMRQSFWTPEEITMQIDRENFKELPFHIQEILIHNLLFQTLMDSGQNRGLDNVLSELTTSSAWEAVFKTQGYFELIHSLSYSHIIREMFSADATKVFDRIYNIPQIKDRIAREVQAYDNIKQYLNSAEIQKLPSIEMKQAVLELLIYIYFLEGLKFYVSFLVTYTINANFNDAIPGVTKIIKLINFDEDMHVSVDGGLLNILQTDEKEGFSELFKNDWFAYKVKEIVNIIVNDELKWGEFLLSLGPIPTLTMEVFKNFLYYYANNRLKRINCEPMFNIKRTDVVDWFDLYKDLNKDNTAQQEATALNYNIGAMDFDYQEKDLKKMLNDLLNRDVK